MNIRGRKGGGGGALKELKIPQDVITWCVRVAEGISKTLRAEIQKYNSTLETLRAIALNRQQINLQLIEIKEALSELEKLKEGEKVYKAVGRIMVSRSKEELIRELNEKKEALEVRLSSLQKQEKLLKEQLEDLEKRISRKLGGKGGLPEAAG